MGRLTAAIAMAVLLAGCQLASSPTPTPIPSPTPHTPVSSAVLQAADLSTPLTSCANSGPIAAYITALQTSNPALGQEVSTQWQSLKNAGATEAAIAVLVSDQAGCSAELGASGSVKSAASLVVSFGNEGQADRAWDSGILGFAPPAPGQTPPGLARGIGTGLGPSSWTYDHGAVVLACWRKSVFVALVVITNLDASAFKTATAAVDARLN